MDQVTDRRAHSDRVPPRSIDLNGWIGKIARHHQLRIERTCFRMTHAARSGGIHQEDGPLRAAGTRRKRFVAFDDVATVNFLDARSKSDRLAGFTRLRLTTPRNPLLTAFNYTCKPARLLLFVGHAVEQHERVDVSFPATRQRHIDARDLLRHHPKREDVACVWTKPQSAVFLRHHGGKQTGAKKIVKIFERKRRGAIVFSGPLSEVFTSEHANAIDQFLLLAV